MDESGATLVAKNGCDLAALLADDAHGVGPRIGAKSAADLAPARVTDGHCVAALEGAIHPRHPGGQQTLASQQGLDRPGIDVDDALGLELTGDPAFARGDWI